MAGRNIKEGLDYFRLDVNYGTDDEVGLIDTEFGPAGYRIITKLLQRIYGRKGYYIDWSEKRRILFASSLKEKGSLVDEVVARSIKWGLFDETVFNKFGVLTSTDIQLAYLDAAKRRDRIEIIREFSLCDINVNQNAIFVNINSISVDENIQSRVEKSTEEESRVKKKEEGPPSAAPPAPKKQKTKKTRQEFIQPSQEQLRAYMLKLRGDDWGEAKCNFLADFCLDHYRTNGWAQNRGKPVVDWRAAVRNWIRREESGEFGRRAMASAPPPPKPGVPALSKTQTELNYLYSRWLEDPAQVTVISVQSEHYNELKRGGLIAFAPDQVEAIRKLASGHMASHGLQGEQKQTALMKAFGVLEFFKMLKSNAKQTIYEPPAGQPA